jgi:hypothetical protein
MMKKIHYIATLSIKRVEEYEGTGRGDDKSLRKVGEVGAVTVRAQNMDNLRQKVKDHLLVLDDDQDIPLDEINKVTR